MKPELSLSSLNGLIMVVTFCSTAAALAATDEIEVGVTAASVTNAVGKPPISPARNLETGLEVFFNEKIETNPSGRAQLLFRDGTSLTVGSNSEMTIDEYVFDPDTGTGELVINVSKGIFRLVGGKISKNTPVVFNTKTATVAVRGGIAMLNVNPTGIVQADFIYGQQMTLTTIVAATGESATRNTSRAGTFIAAEPNQMPSQVQKREPATLAAMINDLERPVKNPSPAAGESTPQSTGSEASVSLAQEDQAETDQAEAAGTEPTPQVSQKEEADSPPTEPAADTEIATAEPQADSEGIPPEPGDAGKPLARQVGDENPVREPQPGSNESLVMTTPEGTTTKTITTTSTRTARTTPADSANLRLAPLPTASPASEPIQNLARADVSVIPPPDIGMNLQISSMVGKLGENVSTYIPPIVSPIGSNPSAVSREPVVMVNNIVIAVDAVTKAPGVKTDDGEYVTAPTTGYAYSTKYHFTGTTEKDKPTHFEYAATTTKTCEDEKCKSSTSYTPVATTCDPTVEYCPEPTKTFTTTSTKTDGTTTETFTTTSTKTDGTTTETFTTSSTTTSCDALTKCETRTYTTKPTEIKASTTKPTEIKAATTKPTETRTSTTKPTETRTSTTKPTETRTYTIKPTKPKSRIYIIISSRAGAESERVVSGLVVRDGKGALSTSVTQADSKVEIVGDQIPLCHECRFLNWYRTTTRMASAHNSTVQIQHWVAGAVSTAAELAGAASKTARYSGGLVGSVALPGQITEKLGSFDAQVRFGVSHYQVQNFNAAFDGRSYLGSSASTRNDALFNAVATSGGRVMSAQGYFFGTPAPGTPPPEIGGHFQVTGGGYDAGGVFAGARH